MLIDASAGEVGAVEPADVCIVGAGAAGITLARELTRRGRTVLLLESGGLQLEAATQALYDGTSVGDPYLLAASRLRYFGGSTNHWGGMCRELDADDFLARAWLPYSGWPIRKADLAPYYAPAFEVLEIPPRRRFEEVERDLDAYPRFFDAADPSFEPLLWLKSRPTRMGARYRDEIARGALVRCVLHANVIEVVPNATGSLVVALRAKTLGGREMRFTARHYVLAAGGIENARLLLLSDSVVAGGLGNGHDVVGRFFQEHPNISAGRMIATPAPGARGFQEEYVQERSRAGLTGVWDVFFGFVATPAVRERHRLLGCSIDGNWPVPRPADPADEGIADLLGDARARSYGLGVIAEQAPNPQSRVRITDDRDALGQRKVAVDLRVQPIDVRSIRKTLGLFALEVARSGRGRVRLDPLPEAKWTIAVGHHIGTTRMSDDPQRGVTDRNGTVHGIANLHVAGSSLFPTGGYANPTLTIVALALRQAEWLAAAAGSRAPDVRS